MTVRALNNLFKKLVELLSTRSINMEVRINPNSVMLMIINSPNRGTVVDEGLHDRIDQKTLTAMTSLAAYFSYLIVLAFVLIWSDL